MAAYAQDTSFFSRRGLVFLAVVGFHVLMVWALASGLARKVVQVIAQPLETDIIDEIEKQDEPPPPPPPELERPPVEVPPPDIQINIPMETSTSTAITDVTDKPVPKAPPPPPPPKARKAPSLDVRRSPSTDDYYPPTSKRLEEEGVVTVNACVDASGRTSGATVEKSSGFGRLDEAAVKWANRARWKPGTEDGQPVAMCQAFNVRFKLTN
ncbi:MAG: energy transducer TonB [Steroidobacteraceae bacterium]